MRQILLCLLGILLPLAAYGKEYNILAYNVYFRPDPVGWWDFKQERYQEFLNHANNYDILGLPEMFDDEMREDFIQKMAATHPYVVNPPHSGGIWEDGGILLMSRYPITYSAKTIFTDYGNWDAFAEKGVIFARIQLPTGQIEVALTHAQAGGEFSQQRQNQLIEMNQFLQKHVSGLPLFLIGDFNVRDTSWEYSEMLNSLENPVDTFRVLYSDDPGYTSNGIENPLAGGRNPKRIDYIFLQDKDNALSLKDCQVNKFPMKNPIKDALFMSDHYAVEVDFSFNEPTIAAPSSFVNKNNEKKQNVLEKKPNYITFSVSDEPHSPLEIFPKNSSNNIFLGNRGGAAYLEPGDYYRKFYLGTNASMFTVYTTFTVDKEGEVSDYAEFPEDSRSFLRENSNPFLVIFGWADAPKTLTRADIDRSNHNMMIWYTHGLTFPLDVQHVAFYEYKDGSFVRSFAPMKEKIVKNFGFTTESK